MNRWKKLALETLSKSAAAADIVDNLADTRAGGYTANILRNHEGEFWVCFVLGTPGWETEPLKNITGEVLAPGDSVLLLFTTNSPQTGYILHKL